MPQTLLTADQIFASNDLDEETVDVPEWSTNGSPGRLRLCQMSSAEYIEWTKVMQNPEIAGEAGENGMFLMLVFTCKDASGERVFTIDQLQQLQQKNFFVVDRLQKVAIRLNRMSAEQQEDTKKASGEVATSGSPTA